MFGKHRLDMSNIITTSKMSLKMSCLSACGNDIAQAERLYEYLSDGISGLPDIEPIKPSGLQQVKQSADDIIGWIGSHRDDIERGISVVQSFRNKGVQVNAIANNVEPIPNETI